jgi:hypothetical protein
MWVRITERFKWAARTRPSKELPVTCHIMVRPIVGFESLPSHQQDSTCACKPRWAGNQSRVRRSARFPTLDRSRKGESVGRQPNYGRWRCRGKWGVDCKGESLGLQRRYNGSQPPFVLFDNSSTGVVFLVLRGGYGSSIRSHLWLRPL